MSQTDILLQAGTNELEIITFFLQWRDQTTESISRTAYGINAAKVRELVAMPETLTEIPESVSSMKGVFLLRDRTIPLVDLCDWFGYEPDHSPEAKAKWVVIVTEINGKFFGFIAHGVDKVYRVSWTAILPPPPIISHYSSLTGVCLVDGNIIQMVDFESIIATIDPSMVIDSEAHAISGRPEGARRGRDTPHLQDQERAAVHARIPFEGLPPLAHDERAGLGQRHLERRLQVQHVEIGLIRHPPRVIDCNKGCTCQNRLVTFRN